MIRLLAGTTHAVLTGVAAARDTEVRAATDAARVTLRPMSNTEVDAYLATGQWRGKAGGYGLQNNDPFLERVAGADDTVIGLPVGLAVSLLGEL